MVILFIAHHGAQLIFALPSSFASVPGKKFAFCFFSERELSTMSFPSSFSAPCFVRVIYPFAFSRPFALAFAFLYVFPFSFAFAFAFPFAFAFAFPFVLAFAFAFPFPFPFSFVKIKKSAASFHSRRVCVLLFFRGHGYISHIYKEKDGENAVFIVFSLTRP